jgi:hypothetical protein
MSKHKIFSFIDRLARDVNRPALVSDNATQRLRTRTAGFTAGFSAMDEAPPIFEPRSRSSYYSVIARAVSNLPNNNRESRQALYDRAGVALATLLLDKGDQVSDTQIEGERLALERAIRKVEGEARQKEQPATPEQVQEKRRGVFISLLSFPR